MKAPLRRGFFFARGALARKKANSFRFHYKALADQADALAGFGLYKNLAYVHAQNFRDRRADVLPVRKELWRLQFYDAIQVFQAPAGGAYVLPCCPQKFRRVGVFPFHVFWRKVASDVAKAGGAKQRVGNCVQERVAVGMAVLAFVKGEDYAAKNERPAFHKSVQVRSQADAENGSADGGGRFFVLATIFFLARIGAAEIFWVCDFNVCRCAGDYARFFVGMHVPNFRVVGKGRRVFGFGRLFMIFQNLREQKALRRLDGGQGRAF